jgi:hypothetical protein
MMEAEAVSETPEAESALTRLMARGGVTVPLGSRSLLENKRNEE